MKIVFSSAVLSNAFRVLTAASRISQRMEAAVRFSIQLAIAVAIRDQAKVHRTRDLMAGRRPSETQHEEPRFLRILEAELFAQLSTWCDEEGALALRLQIHDMTCVLGELEHAAQLYARHVVDMRSVEVWQRRLAVAAVAFTIQLAIEKAESDVVALRDLERDLISTLEEPLDLGAFALKVDAQHGATWGPPLKEE